MLALRVGTLNQLLFGGALLLLGGVLAVDTVSLVGERNAAERTAEFSRAGKDLFGALQNFRAQRGPGRIALQAAQPAAETTLADLARANQTAQTSVAHFLEACRAISCAPAPEQEAIRSARDALEALRPQVITDLGLPLEKRSEGIAERWNKSATALIDRLEKTSNALSNEIRMVDPVIAILVDIKNDTWEVRDHTGLSRNNYGDILQSNSLTPAMAAKQNDFEARTDGAWSRALDLIAQPGTPPSLAEVIRKAHDDYAGTYLPMVMGIRDAVAAGKPAKIGMEEFMRSSSATLGLLIKMPETALTACVDYAEGRAAAATRRLIVELLVFAAAIAVGLIGILVIRRRIVRPIDGIVAAMEEVAKGHLDNEIPYADRADEIGDLAAALGVFKANAVEKERLAAQEAETLALRQQRQAVIEAAIGDFEAASGALLSAFAQAATRMTGTSQSMSVTAEETLRQATAVVSASDMTSANVQTVAGATEELSASIDEISRQVAQSAEIAGRAVEEASRTDQTVHGLSEAASKIGEVVQMIQDIASQTNLLALNATIEAARAGEAGKGFAVVAGEVKTLASQTARATDDIARQIAAIQAVALESVEAIRGIGSTIGEISGIATAIASAVEEQGAATRDIAQNVQQASLSVHEVGNNIAGVSRAADQTGGAAQEVMQASAEITRQAGDLRQQVTSFLGRIRAA
ncbi:MAG TPA: HAMP domain-containing methyl-accepting chemotaxis protein [Magnetospirillaceae bacterium]|nr:HAMP domain-containing methyl-accepting chemotaxis protein [Magnetospirillaceae bacterium]